VIVMARRVRVAAMFLLASATAAPVCAQGGYIGAFLVTDVARFDQYDRTGRDDAGNGEALGFGLRLGTELGSRWGVEVEFVRPGEITSEVVPDVLPLATQPAFTLTPAIPGLPTPVPEPLVFPSYSYRFRTRQRNTTLSTALWVRQEISPRFSLAYVGGVAFGRTSREVEVTFEPVRPVIFPIPPSVSETTTYDVGPMVGVEGRIRMGGHVNLVPGLRLHAIEGGWLIRPALGLAWVF
jgi:hypothetical protein